MTRMQAEQLAMLLNENEGNLSIYYALVADINASTYYVGRFVGGKLKERIKS